MEQAACKRHRTNSSISYNHDLHHLHPQAGAKQHEQELDGGNGNYGMSFRQTTDARKNKGG